MFESTLEAQGLNDGERRVGSLSVAVVAHLGAAVIILAITAMIVPPVKPPEIHDSVFVVAGIIPKAPETPRPSVPAPLKGSADAKPNRAVLPAPIEPMKPPTATPDTPSNPPPDDSSNGPKGDGNGPFGDPNGRIDGVPDGTGLDGVDGSDGGPPGDPVYVTGEMVRPRLLVKVEPSYPEVARRAGLGGRVTVQAIIGTDGGVESAVIFASTNPLFDAAALDAVKKWRYSPATMSGRPVRVYFTVVVDFIVR